MWLNCSPGISGTIPRISGTIPGISGTKSLSCKRLYRGMMTVEPIPRSLNFKKDYIPGKKTQFGKTWFFPLCFFFACFGVTRNWWTQDFWTISSMGWWGWGELAFCHFYGSHFRFFGLKNNLRNKWTNKCGGGQTHRIHVWYIYLHLP